MGVGGLGKKMRENVITRKKIFHRGVKTVRHIAKDEGENSRWYNGLGSQRGSIQVYKYTLGALGGE